MSDAKIVLANAIDNLTNELNLMGVDGYSKKIRVYKLKLLYPMPDFQKGRFLALGVGIGNFLMFAPLKQYKIGMVAWNAVEADEVTSSQTFKVNGICYKHEGYCGNYPCISTSGVIVSM